MFSNMDRNKLEKVYSWSNALRVACVWYLVSHVDCYNLDVEKFIPFQGPNRSLFGYSVLLHSHGNESWVVVGAPVASGNNHSISSPGAIFKCNINQMKDCQQLPFGSDNEDYCGKHCLGERDNQWFGVSLSRQSQGNLIVACGHRWKNIFYMSGRKNQEEHKLPHGICYKIQPDLKSRALFNPCYQDHQRKFGEKYGSCQAGISNFMMEDLIIVGAPGAFYWTGSVLVLNTTTGSKYAYVDDDNLVLYGSYLGYSVSAGHFTTPDSTEVVGGAPQNGQTGKAYVFQIQQESKVLKVIFQAKGKMLGSYFGASVCAADLNGDGLSDLLVGAPMYSTVREEGRVYVYMNVGEGKMEEAEFELMGSNLYSARFGEAIIDLGDIDDDGISDVAIGAPQEEDLQGAIYIYNGKRKGISQTFSQKITGSLMGNGFSMFGQSLSGGIDVDGNGYSDLVVGAYLSDSAVLLRARAIVIVETSLLLPPSFNRTKPIMCSENRQPAVCMNVTMCFRVKGRHIPGHIVFQYNVSADIKRNAEDLSRFYFVGGTNGTSGQVSASHNTMVCKTHQAFVRKEVRDIYTPIHFEATYQIGNHIVNNSGHLPPLKPMLQQREGENNIVKNQTMFARYCAWANCSANLHVSASLVLPQSHENKQYFALGSGKTIILNVKLVNDGDDALLTVLHLRFPSNLYFIKVLDSVEKYISCEVAEEKRIVVGVDCTVGHYYVNSLSKTNISFLLDVNGSSSPGDLNITVNATCANEGKTLLSNNFAYLLLPLRYGVEINLHGFVSPSSFEFGGDRLNDCYAEKLNYTFSVINVGPSKVSNIKLSITMPRRLVPYPYSLFNSFNIKSTHGQCNSTLDTLKSDCDIPEPTFLQDVVFFFEKTGKREMYCMKEDHACVNIICELIDVDIGKEATVQLEVELNPLVLDLSPGRASIMLLETTASASSNISYAVAIQDSVFTRFYLEAHHDKKPNSLVAIFIIAGSLFLGILILALLTYCLWKIGFFKRSFERIKEESRRRDSWDYVLGETEDPDPCKEDVLQ